MLLLYQLIWQIQFNYLLLKEKNRSIHSFEDLKSILFLRETSENVHSVSPLGLIVVSQQNERGATYLIKELDRHVIWHVCGHVTTSKRLPQDFFCLWKIITTCAFDFTFYDLDLTSRYYAVCKNCIIWLTDWQFHRLFIQDASKWSPVKKVPITLEEKLIENNTLWLVILNVNWMIKWAVLGRFLIVVLVFLFCFFFAQMLHISYCFSRKETDKQMLAVMQSLRYFLVESVVTAN